MSEQKHVWFLMGIKPGENNLLLFAMNWSEQGPEFATEHEPRALAAMKKRVPKEIEGFRLHACRMTLYNDPAHLQKEAKRWREELRRFFARCDLTVVEQKDLIEELREKLLSRFREIEDSKAGIKPLPESLWGKSNLKLK